MFVFLRFVFLWLILATNLLSAEVYEEGELVLSKKPLFVSLGSTCHTALALRANELRKAAFPFDWWISTNHETFIRILDSDFLFFTDENYFYRHEGVPAIANQYYNIVFPHDFDLTKFSGDQGMQQWNNFKTKYDRRIDRFRKLREYPGKVFFVRAMWSQLVEGEHGEFNENTKKALELKCTLDRYFPSLDFTLIIISYKDLNIPKMLNIEGVVEFRIERSHQDFKNRAEKLLGN